MRSGIVLAVCVLAAVRGLAAEVRATAELRGWQPMVVAEAPGAVFALDEACVFRRAGAVRGETWRIVDWKGDERRTGRWPDDGRLSVTGLSAGCYALEDVVPQSARCPPDRRCGFTVAGPIADAVRRANRFYACDSALSWISGPQSFVCPWNGGDTYRTVVDLIARAGFSHARERLVPMADGSCAGGHYLDNARLFRSRGIAVGGMFHSVPPCLRPDPKLPRNLVALFDCCRGVNRTFGNLADSWEFWNEEDIHYAPEPAWTYAAALKAAYLGFKAGDAARPVTMGALLLRCRKGGYCESLCANDLAYCTDAFVYHCYDSLVLYPEDFRQIRARLAEAGMAGLAIDVTECGTNMIGPSRLPSAKPGVAAQSPEQEMVLAEFYPKSQVLLQMEGVSRCDYFVFGPFLRADGLLDRGVMRRDGTVKPIWAAIHTMVGLLGDAVLEGEIAVAEGLRAFAFRKPDGRCTIVHWKQSAIDLETGGEKPMSPVAADQNWSLSAERGSYETYDIFGGKTSVRSENGRLSLMASCYPSYVVGLKTPSIRTRPHARGKRGAVLPPADLDTSLIVAVDLCTNDFTLAKDKASALVRGQSGGLDVTVWNLSDRPRPQTSLMVSGGRLEGVPAEFDVPAKDKRIFRAHWSASSVKGVEALVVQAISQGRRSTRCTVPLRLALP